MVFKSVTGRDAGFYGRQGTLQPADPWQMTRLFHNVAVCRAQPLEAEE
jgi:hypothetical protein